MIDIYSVLFNRIIAGEYPTNTRLKEEVLSTEFKTSRTPVRAVLQQLEQDGLVEISPNKGAKVLLFSADEIEEIYEIRKSLELLCIEISAPILSMQKLLEFKMRMFNNINEQDINIHIDLDAKLHDYIIISTGRKRLIQMLSQLFRLIQRFRSLGFTKNDSKESSMREHIQIIEALCMRDTGLAKELMRKHIDNSKMIVLSQSYNYKNSNKE